MAVLLDESLVELHEMRVEIDCTRDVSRGATLGDRRGQTGPANARVARRRRHGAVPALIVERLGVR